MSTFPTDKEKTSLHEIRLLFDSLDVQGDVASGYTLSGNRVTINCKDRQIAESLMLKFAGQVEPVTIRAGKFSLEPTKAMMEREEYLATTTLDPSTDDEAQQHTESLPKREADVKEHRTSGRNGGG
ncbi:hypothetical protein Pmar_PMAR019925 [Perkinsus marinus ATCC 50983]|uniref:Uncharacterized protein n=1 Tax=Perkinsus marinus (strain ATCC 50983 / TXsc) TaxID=423536 RepID=C5KC11_PERM5|nr:hypothetical protein Pmar_PMAR019925 [Perkinsus marinus ATCC 50983]EER18042.1 hypothetical protein Pmar_PMAR019925 [Perkinsus marinus ATCC 50983]|eukprot:XP_002786246.1 hypothetical protein Pmar_PMAR019925 [Perkinsus marinus ATCC 50983]